MSLQSIHRIGKFVGDNRELETLPQNWQQLESGLVNVQAQIVGNMAFLNVIKN